MQCPTSGFPADLELCEYCSLLPSVQTMYTAFLTFLLQVATSAFLSIVLFLCKRPHLLNMCENQVHLAVCTGLCFFQHKIKRDH